QEASNMPAQRHWRWCRQCQGLFFGGGSDIAGICSASRPIIEGVLGPHDGRASGDYLLHFVGQAPGGQSEWKRCRRCQGLYFGDNGRAGLCPTGQPHEDSLTGTYRVLLAGNLVFDQEVFLARYPIEFGEALTSAGNLNLALLLAFLEQDPHIEEIRWLAYML